MARLQVFRGGWDPERFELDGLQQVTVGRALEAELRVQHDRLARRHLRLDRRGAEWWVADMGSSNSTEVNGGRIRDPWRLEHGDVVSVIDFAFAYETRDEQRSPELEAAIVARPGDAGAVAVWADWLLEHGDPFGERLAWAAKQGTVHPATTGGLEGNDFVWHGKLGLEHGLLASVSLRSHGQNANVKMLLSRLLHLRAARFLRELRVDLAGLSSIELLSELDPLLDRLPKSLELLDLGYALDRPDLVLTDAQAAKLPRLRDRRVQRGRVQARLSSGGQTLAVTPALSFEMGSGRPTIGQSGPSGRNGFVGDQQVIFRRGPDSWTLIVSSAIQHRVKVNGRGGHAHGLLDGDKLEIGLEEYRFELH
ncbi:MAG: FHA domain-containing protein [Myxococcaceae bacterium]